MYDRLIENMILFENVDPNRVYFLGYSAGGDGVYQIAPRLVEKYNFIILTTKLVWPASWS